MTFRAALPLLAFTALLSCGVGAVYAQLPADAEWHTLESSHFRITYTAGLEDLARHAAAAAERARAALIVLVADAPAEPVDIVLADNVDFSNGYATPFPSNRIVIYAAPPADDIELQYTRDWIELVVTHELTHIFHLDVSGSAGRIARRIFGRIPWPWPVFTALGSPSWSVEGLAVLMESTIAGQGRARGSYNEMVVRTATLEDEIDSLDELSSASPVWPGGSRVYIYGSLFLDYVARHYGDDAAARIVRSTAGSIFPAPLWFGRIGRAALGASFREAYTGWRAELAQRSARLERELARRGVTVSQTLTLHGGAALYPRYSPDGNWIAYAANDRRTTPHTRVIDAQTGEQAWSERRNDIAVADWLPDGRILTSTIDYVDPFRVYNDVWIVSNDDTRRVTRGARLHDLDVSSGGRGVAVEIGGGTNRLVLFEPLTGERRVLSDFDSGTQWSLPRFSPDGTRIAVGRWRTGGIHDIVVIDTLGAVRSVVAAGAGISAGPAWSADGQWLLFWSDRTGIPNLFAWDLAHAALRQVTSVLTGAFFPDVSPDGRWIAFSKYHHDGFRVERIPFDPSQWREPMSDALTTMASARGAYDTPATADLVMDRAAAAAAAADTATAMPGAYRPLRHLRPFYWMPLLGIDDASDDYIGLASTGSDLVGRHAWMASVLLAPGSGRTQGSFGYAYRGLPPFAVSGLHPTLSVSATRDWDVLVAADRPDGLFVDEREDAVAAAIDLTHVRWRSRAGVTLSAELVHRSRILGNADSLVLQDPGDDMLGTRASAYFSNAVQTPFAISRQDGVTLQAAARHRWDRSDEPALSGSYSELTTHNSAFLALSLPGFARHVLAARVSGLLRTGDGAAPASIGGASSQGIDLNVDIDFLRSIGGTSRLLPVRGFESGTRYGTRAWTASAEYRFPVSLLQQSLRPLPIFIDRLAGSAFLDAGDAWCDTRSAARLPAGFCPIGPASEPLLSAGLELTAFLSAWGGPLPLRLGAALPLQGATAAHDGVRFHLLIGPSF